MKIFNQAVLSMVISGCSGSAASGTTASQSEPLAIAPVAPTVLTPKIAPPPPPGILTLPGPVQDPTVLAALRSIALRASSLTGVPSASTMRAVAVSDHQAAESIISGAIINDHAPVYVLEISGGVFTSPHHPPGALPPQGNVLTVTVDAATYRVTDVGYHDVAPDLVRIASLPVDL